MKKVIVLCSALVFGFLASSDVSAAVDVNTVTVITAKSAIEETLTELLNVAGENATKARVQEFYGIVNPPRFEKGWKAVWSRSYEVEVVNSAVTFKNPSDARALPLGLSRIKNFLKDVQNQIDHVREARNKAERKNAAREAATRGVEAAKKRVKAATEAEAARKRAEEEAKEKANTTNRRWNIFRKGGSSNNAPVNEASSYASSRTSSRSSSMSNLTTDRNQQFEVKQGVRLGSRNTETIENLRSSASGSTSSLSQNNYVNNEIDDDGYNNGYQEFMREQEINEGDFAIEDNHSSSRSNLAQSANNISRRNSVRDKIEYFENNGRKLSHSTSVNDIRSRVNQNKQYPLRKAISDISLSQTERVRYLELRYLEQGLNYLGELTKDDDCFFITKDGVKKIKEQAIADFRQSIKKNSELSEEERHNELDKYIQNAVQDYYITNSPFIIGLSKDYESMNNKKAKEFNEQQLTDMYNMLIGYGINDQEKDWITWAQDSVVEVAQALARELGLSDDATDVKFKEGWTQNYYIFTNSDAIIQIGTPDVIKKLNEIITEKESQFRAEYMMALIGGKREEEEAKKAKFNNQPGMIRRAITAPFKWLGRRK